jgi:hypothetical protein
VGELILEVLHRNFVFQITVITGGWLYDGNMGEKGRIVGL